MQSAHALTAQMLLRASTSDQRHAIYAGYRDALENAGASELEGLGSGREALIHRLLIGSDPATTAHLASFVLSPQFTESAARALNGTSTRADEGTACMLSLACTLMAGGVALPIGLGSRHLPLESVLESLRVPSTLTATLKENAVKQQIERHNELVRSAMRAVRALEKLPDAETVAKFGEMVRTNLKTGKLAERYAAVIAEEQAPEEGGAAGAVP
jgi:hypothetical protein